MKFKYRAVTANINAIMVALVKFWVLIVDYKNIVW